jgi:hypothetical protein
MKMNLIPVTSSTIKSVGYQDDDLYIEYQSGQIYKYSKVPRTLYENLLHAESKGRYLNTEIKNKFIYEKILKEG